MTCGIRQDGLVAPFLIDGAMDALDAFSPQECRNLFAACGYDCE